LRDTFAEYLPNTLRPPDIRDIDLMVRRTPSTRNSTPSGGQPVKQLIAYLLDHAMLDFSGDLSLETVRDFLRDDDSPEARTLMSKLSQDKGVDDMVVTMADCLQEYLRTGLNETVVRDQLKLYTES
jgi:hypothetical protein